jgi:AraC family transcriptional regulator of adaptative response/methylated-DNA-[protein]-cysteine methyltransferase
MSPFDRIAQSLTTLTSTTSAPPLQELAAQAGMSPFHFQRTFQRLVGVSPLQLQQVLRVESAREALLRSRSVLEASWDAGFSGPGRLHDAMLRVERMTPGELKSGSTLRWSEAHTDLGSLTVAASPRGVCGVSFDGLESLAARWPGATFEKSPRALANHVEQLERRLAGEKLTQPLALVLRGTDLQLAVWRALLALPSGTVTTYSDLAEAVGRPAATRAVANAVGANHVAWLIPCHRVIRATGALGGYRWGLARKSALLAREWSSDFVEPERLARR